MLLYRLTLATAAMLAMTAAASAQNNDAPPPTNCQATPPSQGVDPMVLT